MINPVQRPPGFFDPTNGMPPWVPKLLAQIVVIVVSLWALFHVTRALRGFLIILLMALFLSIAFEPGVSYLEKRGARRGVATAGIFGAAVLVGAAVIGLMVPVVVSQLRELVDKLPTYSMQVSTWLARFNIDVSSENILESLGGTDALRSDLGNRALGVGGAVIGTVFQLLTLGLFTFYFTADAPRIRRNVLRVFPPARQRELLRIQDIAIDKTGGYVYSRLLLAGAATFVAWVVFKFIGVDFAEPLALWVGIISQFVPVVGTYLAGIIPVLIALLDSPTKALAVLIFIILYQQFENYLVSPRITSRTMSLHPAVSFGSAIAGATLLGAPGALMALPVAATVQAWISTWLEYHEPVDRIPVGDPTETVTPGDG